MSKSRIILCAAIALSALPLPAQADDRTVHTQVSKPCPQFESSNLSADSQSALPIKYIGNAESRKFHRPSCPFARVMALNKRVGFHYRSQAVACGHVPCLYCLPPVWTTVRGRLLLPAKTPGTEPKLPEGPLCQPHLKTLCDPPVEIAPDPP